VAVICHPHPLHGGSMQNKVVHTLARTFNGLDLAALRFNFRGVGASAGRYDEGRGEQADLRAVLRWVAARHHGGAVWLAGFSFGAHVALAVAQDAGLDGLVLVAPPVNHFDFSGLGGPAGFWVVVQGEDDEVVPAGEVERWIDGLERRPHLVRMSGVGHFFHGRLNDLKAALERTVAPRLDAAAGLPAGR
jgi:alpha/beta superfamily hydrolase